MSRASKFTLAATGLATAGIVYFVHWAQEADRAVSTDLPHYKNYRDTNGWDSRQAMHKGVERDMEKQRIRRERQAEFEMQKTLEQEYLKLQTVSSSTGDQSPAGQTPTPGT